MWFESHTNQHVQELTLYEFELNYKVTEGTKNICCVKAEDAVDHSTETRWLKKFLLGYKNFDDQTRSGRL